MLLKELKALSAQLTNEKFLHFLLEPVLLWGVLTGTLAWMVSLWWLQDRRAQLCSLLLLAVSAFTIYPVMDYRAKASPIPTGSIFMLNAQNTRRADTQWAYYALGGLAVSGLFLTGAGRGKLGTALGVTIVAAGLATAVLSLWLHERETAVFHPEARRGKAGAAD
ncbi:MAG: hypothetical protein V4726_04755 [Verrucomicrobiota bacterium]